MANTKKTPWERKRPPGKKTKLTAASKRKAKASAERAGRSYPNLVDNMHAATAQKKSRGRTRKRS